MKVFKFGGASVKDADAIRNMTGIVEKHGRGPLLIVVSAMGKTTNHLEEVVRSVDKDKARENIRQLRVKKEAVVAKLFPASEEIAREILTTAFDELDRHLAQDYSFDQKYDQIVSLGEYISSRLIGRYLETCGLAVQWIDARYFIRTNDHYRSGEVDWEESARRMNEILPDLLKDKILITQGFVGGTDHEMTTTLGREGSDYTAAVYASCLGAESVTVWKDVDGIMNGDPKRIADTRKFAELPYKEAAEMTYYGASVIHPKTIKPLANARIPLFVRSFYHPEAEGTIIHDCSFEAPVPAVIIKDDQCLVSFHVRDFTFVNEQNLSMIFHEVSQADMKIHMMQNSAISFSICVDYEREKLDALIRRLKDHFSVRFNTGLQLITVKNYTIEALVAYKNNQHVLLEQISRNNYRALLATDHKE